MTQQNSDFSPVRTAFEQGTEIGNYIKGTDTESFTYGGMWERKVPWEEAILSEDLYTGADVLKKAGLDWTVVRRPVFVGGLEVENRTGLVRQYETEDGEIHENVLGIVSSKGYHVLQNRDAFDYLDSMVGEGLKYTAAGQLDGGKHVFMVAEANKKWKIGDDDIGGNLLLSNGHDGLHTLRVCITPIRIVCRNTLMAALDGAVRSFSIKHRTNLQDKIQDARRALNLTSIYMDNLRIWGEQLIDTKLSPATVEKYIDDLFPKKEDESKRGKTMREAKINDLWSAMGAKDLAPYNGTAWQFLNAVSDFETHRKAKSDTVMKKVLNENMPLWDAANNLLAVA